jgi:hypothetical protein
MTRLIVVLLMAAVALAWGTHLEDLVVIGGAIAALILVAGCAVFGWLEARDRRRQAGECRGLEAIPCDGHPRLVALAIGELDDVDVVRDTLEHLEQCQQCAENFRLIMIMRGVPARGDVHLTPETLRRLELRDQQRRVM